MPKTSANLTRLSGRLVERGVLRYTPGGVPVLDFVLGHASTQIEDGQARTITVELPCMVFGALAHQLAAGTIGEATVVAASGFLAARSLKRRTPVLHVTHIEFVEENHHGFQTEEQDQHQA